MVNFHGGVGQRAKDGNDGDFPDGHLTNRLQVLVPLLNVHLVFLARRRDQLQGQKEGPFKCCLRAATTHTQKEAYCRIAVYMDAQAERGPFTPICSVKS